MLPIIPIKLRFILIAVCLIGGTIISFLDGGWAWSWMLLIPGIILLLGYFFFGTLASTSQILQTGDFAAAKAQLQLTKKPEWLISFNKGIYHFLNGTINMQENNLVEAENELKIALESNMPSNDYRAQILLSLMSIASRKNRMPQAKEYMKELKGLKVSDPTLKGIIQDTERQMKMAQGNPQGGGFYQRQQGKGSKRVR